MTLLHLIKVLEATHQSTLFIYIYTLYSIMYVTLYICHKQIYFNINLQGNIHNIVTAEISAQIYHCHTQQQSTCIYDYINQYIIIYTNI